MILMILKRFLWVLVPTYYLQRSIWEVFQQSNCSRKLKDRNLGTECIKLNWCDSNGARVALYKNYRHSPIRIDLAPQMSIVCPSTSSIFKIGVSYQLILRYKLSKNNILIAFSCQKTLLKKTMILEWLR